MKKELFMEKSPRRGLKNKASRILINILVTLVLGLLYFYVSLPAINLHDSNFYGFFFVLCIIYVVCALITSGFHMDASGGIKEYFRFIKSQCLPSGILMLLLIVIAILGTVISMPIFRAASYRDLLTVENGDFAAEVEEISFDQIPMLDEQSAQRLGDRKLGELSDMVSQFEVADDYTQINYQGRPVRVTPLNYGDLIKWFNNRSQGLPAYIIVDMVSQEAEVVRLPEGMKYSPSEPLNRNVMRHLRFTYPTYMFSTPTFEIDESGHPYWVCPKPEMTIGLFGGRDIDGAVLMDAVTGECEYYEDVPTWVDRVYLASLIMEQYDYHGTLVNGFINSIFGQRDVTHTTAGFNYIALSDDVYMYTGVTSVGSDQSNVGFLLSNQRTKETKYYKAPGATEQSAMASAQGKVQHLQYQATFPLLLNISGQPTYFIALKDAAQLVKMYAMVNVSQYQIVGIGNTVAECEKDYILQLAENNITTPEVLPETTISGAVEEFLSAVLDGNTYYFVRLEGEDVYYSLSALDNPAAVILKVGDSVTIDHAPQTGEEVNPILNGYSLTIDGKATPDPIVSPEPAVSAPEAAPDASSALPGAASVVPAA